VIFFIPGYDPATESNLAVGERIVPEVCQPLLRDRATRKELLAALSHAAVPLFAMSHGHSDALLAQGNEKGLTKEDLSVVGPRSVFAYACHTAGMLGKAAAQGGAIWWGYTGAVTAPDSSALLLPVFVEIFFYLREIFPEAESSEECRMVLLRVAELCEKAQLLVDDLGAEDANLDVMSPSCCLLHIWQRLRVWRPGADSPLKHPDAPLPLLFL
jgi:hypothetical protein